MKKNSLLLLLAAGHGLNDLIAGYLLGSIVQSPQDITTAGISLLVYNLLAFGGQYPVALWLEKQFTPKTFLLAAAGINLLAVVLFATEPAVSVVLMGVASAVYHVAGGTVCAAQQKAFSIGVFAAPGVAGLIAGGYFAWQTYQLIPILAAAAFLFLLLLAWIKFDRAEGETTVAPSASMVPDRHDLLMILLLTVISLRSAVWNIFQLVHEREYDWLIAIAAAAFAGKIIGGWLADRIGWRLYIFLSLITAAPLVSFCKNELILFCTGIGLLQSGIPATTALLIRSVRGKTARGISLSFGVAIIAGALVFAVPPVMYIQHPYRLMALSLTLISVMVALMLLVKRKAG